MSPLVQGRGLKRGGHQRQVGPCPSPLVQGRGLKQRHVQDDGLDGVVAPRAGAWIETAGTCRATDRRSGRPSCRGVD